jgi:hypothetical protein
MWESEQKKRKGKSESRVGERLGKCRIAQAAMASTPAGHFRSHDVPPAPQIDRSIFWLLGLAEERSR